MENPRMENKKVPEYQSMRVVRDFLYSTGILGGFCSKTWRKKHRDHCRDTERHGEQHVPSHRPAAAMPCSPSTRSSAHVSWRCSPACSFFRKAYPHSSYLVKSHTGPRMSMSSAVPLLEEGHQVATPTITDHVPTESAQRSSVPSPSNTPSMAMSPYQHIFLGNVAVSLNDPRYSDLALMGPTAVLRVHKIIVCPQSPWLTAKVQELDEARCVSESSPKDTVLRMPPEIDNQTLELVVQFLYTQDYDYEYAPKAGIECFSIHIDQGPANCQTCKLRKVIEEIIVHICVSRAGQLLSIAALEGLTASIRPSRSLQRSRTREVYKMSLRWRTMSRRRTAHGSAQVLWTLRWIGS